MTEIEQITPAEIRSFRDGLGLTQADLAARLGGSTRGVEDWEAGRRQPPAMLRLALSALARGVQPWTGPKQLRPGATMDDISEVASHRFAVLGDHYAIDIDDEWRRGLADTATPAEALLLAHVLGKSDGYNKIHALEDWSARPTKGWETNISHRPNVEGSSPSFMIACRDGDVEKQIAVFIDAIRPGERLPRKVQIETALIARGVRVLTFSETDVLVDPEAVSDTVETVISEVMDEVLVARGHIANAWVSPSRREAAAILDGER